MTILTRDYQMPTPTFEKEDTMLRDGYPLPVINTLIKNGTARFDLGELMGVYREWARIESWKELARRSGLSVWTVRTLTAQSREGASYNGNLTTWMRLALAMGRHPFAICRVHLPEDMIVPKLRAFQDPVRYYDEHTYGPEGRDSDPIGWPRASVNRLVDSGKARILIDRDLLAAYRQAAGIDQWKELSKRSGVSVNTIQTIDHPGENASMETWMRLALAVHRHPYEFALVQMPYLEREFEPAGM
jgi:hypothetical protein